MTTSFEPKSEHCAVVAPASRVSDRDFEHFKQICLPKKQVGGMKLKFDLKVLHDKHDFWYASTLDKRTDDLMKHLMDPEVKIIWCLRGGYGSCEVSNKLLQMKFRPTSAKILIGFSDITSLHVLFNQNFSYPSIHGAMLSQCIKNPEKFIPIFDLLKGKNVVFKIKPLNETAKKASLPILGKTSGGNLKTLSTLVGTKIEPNFDNAIIFLEDVNEKPYAIMRDLQHLRFANLLHKASAIVLGDFVQTGSETLEVLKKFSQGINIPIYKTESFGHGAINYPFTLGALGHILSCEGKHEITIESPFITI